MKLYEMFLVLFLIINVGCLERKNMLDTENYSDVGTQSNTDNSMDPEIEMDVLPSSGCGRAPLVSGENEILVNNIIRHYSVNIPSGYDQNFSYPLMFAFHGMGMNGESFKRYNDFTETIGNEAVIVYPDAIGNLPAWDINATQDLDFFDAMLDELSEGLCIDRARIFAAGHSNGASFSNTLGCYRGDILRAIAPVAGRMSDVIDEESCVGQVAVWMAHGENDFIVPFNRGVQARDYWIDENSCNDSSISITPDACIEYAGCDDEYPVQWCTHNKTHRWPDFGTEAISDFFRLF